MADLSSSQAIRSLEVQIGERHRENVRRFEHVDKRFVDLEKTVNKLNVTIAEWIGAARLTKWMLGIGIPVIATAAVTHLVRHW